MRVLTSHQSEQLLNLQLDMASHAVLWVFLALWQARLLPNRSPVAWGTQRIALGAWMFHGNTFNFICWAPKFSVFSSEGPFKIFLGSSLDRGFIKFLCRRSVGFFSQAFLVYLMKESKKRRRKQPGKLMAKSRSQRVNLPGVWPLMNPLLWAFLSVYLVQKPTLLNSNSMFDQFSKVYCK